jgi:hypothetical protein
MEKEIEIVLDYCQYCHNADKNCEVCSYNNK